MATAIKKKAFNPTDHLPNLVFGIKPIFIYFILPKNRLPYDFRGLATPVQNQKETPRAMFKRGFEGCLGCCSESTLGQLATL